MILRLCRVGDRKHRADCEPEWYCRVELELLKSAHKQPEIEPSSSATVPSSARDTASRLTNLTLLQGSSHVHIRPPARSFLRSTAFRSLDRCGFHVISARLGSGRGRRLVSC
jgi:hypothetical protein